MNPPPQSPNSLRLVLLPIAIGFPLVFVAAGLLLGSFETAWQLLVVSMVCSLGVGVTFWFGLAYLAGRIVLYLLRQIRRLRSGRVATGGGDPRRAFLPAICSYIERRQRDGGDPERIRQELAREGWTPVEIEAAFSVTEAG